MLHPIRRPRFHEVVLQATREGGAQDVFVEGFDGLGFRFSCEFKKYF